MSDVTPYKAYEKTLWKNGETPLSADNLNNIEDGIDAISTEVQKIRDEFTDLTENLQTDIDDVDEKLSELEISYNQLTIISGGTSENFVGQSN